jgi:hypothetical protein
MMHVAVIYVPALRAAFHTAPLSAFDWLVSIAVASTLLLAMEFAKMVLRAKRPDPLAAAVRTTHEHAVPAAT